MKKDPRSRATARDLLDLDPFMALAKTVSQPTFLAYVQGVYQLDKKPVFTGGSHRRVRNYIHHLFHQQPPLPVPTSSDAPSDNINAS